MTATLQPFWARTEEWGVGEEQYAWVLAAPFRAHVQRLMLTEGVPWRVVAGLAGVPDLVVRTLVLGRANRARPRLSRDHAAALMELTAPRVRLARCLVVPATPTTLAVRRLRGAGTGVLELADMLDVTPQRARALVSGEQGSTTRLVEHRALAALRAHGLDDDHQDPGRPLIPVARAAA